MNRDLQIQVWNSESEELWGLRLDEAEGQQILNLDIGLPIQQLIQPIRVCLAGNSQYQELTLPATNRRGRAIQCKVTCTPLLGPEKEIRGAILLMEDKTD